MGHRNSCSPDLVLEQFRDMPALKADEALPFGSENREHVNLLDDH